MTTRQKQAVVFFVAGAAFLGAAPVYARLAHAASGNGKAWSILEVVFGAPALAFTFAGAICFIAGVVFLVDRMDKKG